jgi:hypothetical protein
METVKEAKHFLRENAEKGCVCPACGQHVQIYARQITSSMVFALAIIYHQKTDEYIHVENILKKYDCPPATRGDFPKLRFWNLIEPKPGSRDDGSERNGYYRITEHGKSFLTGKLSVPAKIFIYNNKKTGISEDLITVKEALKNKFNFNELIDGSCFKSNPNQGKVGV